MRKWVPSTVRVICRVNAFSGVQFHAPKLVRVKPESTARWCKIALIIRAINKGIAVIVRAVVTAPSASTFTAET